MGQELKSAVGAAKQVQADTAAQAALQNLASVPSSAGTQGDDEQAAGGSGAAIASSAKAGSEAAQQSTGAAEFSKNLQASIQMATPDGNTLDQVTGDAARLVQNRLGKAAVAQAVDREQKMDVPQVQGGDDQPKRLDATGQGATSQIENVQINTPTAMAGPQWAKPSQGPSQKPQAEATGANPSVAFSQGADGSGTSSLTDAASALFTQHVSAAFGAKTETPQTTAAHAQAMDVPLLQNVQVDVDQLAQRTVRWQHLGVLDDGGTARIRLSPPELGSIQIALETVDKVVHVQITAESESTRQLLQNHADQLVQSLSTHGLTAARVQVNLETPQEHHFTENDGGQGQGQPQQDSPDDGSRQGQQGGQGRRFQDRYRQELNVTA